MISAINPCRIQHPSLRPLSFQISPGQFPCSTGIILALKFSRSSLVSMCLVRYAVRLPIKSSNGITDHLLFERKLYFNFWMRPRSPGRILREVQLGIKLEACPWPLLAVTMKLVVLRKQGLEIAGQQRMHNSSKTRGTDSIGPGGLGRR